MDSPSTFVGKIGKARRDLTLPQFRIFLDDYDIFCSIVKFCEENSLSWAREFGLMGKEKQESDVPPEEIVWKQYFDSHNFSDPESARNIADLIHTLTGIDVGRYIKISSRKAKAGNFPRNICIVPLKNPNEHNYPIGKPIMSFREGQVFARADGTLGNNMSMDKDSLRVATESEIRSTLSGIMYHSSSLTEHIAIYVLALVYGNSE